MIAEDPADAAAAVKRFGRAVLKPLYSSKARGMMIVDSGEQAIERIGAFQSAGNPVVYVQKLIGLPGRDLGLVFLGGNYLAAYAREGRKGEWNTTTAAGGRYRGHEPAPEIVALADRAQKPLRSGFHLRGRGRIRGRSRGLRSLGLRRISAAWKSGAVSTRPGYTANTCSIASPEPTGNNCPPPGNIFFLKPD